MQPHLYNYAHTYLMYYALILTVILYTLCAYSL